MDSREGTAQQGLALEFVRHVMSMSFPRRVSVLFFSCNLYRILLALRPVELDLRFTDFDDKPMNHVLNSAVLSLPKSALRIRTF